MGKVVNMFAEPKVVYVYRYKPIDWVGILLKTMVYGSSAFTVGFVTLVLFGCIRLGS